MEEKKLERISMDLAIKLYKAGLNVVTEDKDGRKLRAGGAYTLDYLAEAKWFVELD